MQHSKARKAALVEVADELDRLRAENLLLQSQAGAPAVPPLALAGIAGLVAVPARVTAPTIGVYFLCYLSEVVYVGQSVSVFSRVPAHLGEKEFSRAYFLEVPADDLLRVEQEWIDRLQPRYNMDQRTQGQRAKAKKNAVRR